MAIDLPLNDLRSKCPKVTIAVLCIAIHSYFNFEIFKCHQWSRIANQNAQSNATLIGYVYSCIAHRWILEWNWLPIQFFLLKKNHILRKWTLSIYRHQASESNTEDSEEKANKQAKIKNAANLLQQRKMLQRNLRNLQQHTLSREILSGRYNLVNILSFNRGVGWLNSIEWIRTLSNPCSNPRQRVRSYVW